ncbi:MAG: 4Fe-4S dicluster domain-containing protein [Candidatus Lokiarchaeota archaeon]|nr:4Fe-4S dicluster domain-containing protein [Candidatus Lokiarchaeota archaeon]MBD3198578.1 4Fe-4S dicluster domain-containing protein [Candidatus Lokiarchaeota archaeon]
MDTKAEYLISEDDFLVILKTLLKESFVDKIIGAEEKVSRKTGEVDRFTVSPKAWEKPDDFETYPLSNLISYGYARTDSAAKFLHSTLKGAKGEKVALVARPCDTRALIELQKIRQINLENLFIIGMDDKGIATNVSRQLRSHKDLDTSKIVKEKIGDNGLIFQFEDGKTQEVEIAVSENCSRCIRKTPVIADLSVSDIGIPIEDRNYILKVHSDKGIELLDKSGLKLKDLPKDIKKTHEEKINTIHEEAKVKREKDLEEWNNLPQEEKIEALKKCTMCGMCIRACPVCYCVDCILQKKRKDKKIDNVTYQLTRIAHDADRCVECGSCFNNCPMNLPLSLIFQSLNEQFKETFQYTPGESVEDIPFRSAKAIKQMELEKT